MGADDDKSPTRNAALCEHKFDFEGVAYRALTVRNPYAPVLPEHTHSEIRSNQNVAVLLITAVAKDLKNQGIELPLFKQLAEKIGLATVDADNKPALVADQI